MSCAIKKNDINLQSLLKSTNRYLSSVPIESGWTEKNPVHRSSINEKLLKNRFNYKKYNSVP